jgi:DNA-binding MarR family transcriptional regulator
MKGFYIEIKNELLDKKHRKAMGSAVWEFMWCLDKVTKIDEEEFGYVYGGAPVNLSDIEKELGITQSKISKNLHKLQEAGYLSLTRTPTGITILLNKASKRFAQKGKSFDLKGKTHVPKGKSNIRQGSIQGSNTDSEAITAHSKNWELIQRFIDSQKEKWAAPEYDFPTQKGDYDWRYLLNHGKCAPDTFVVALYWKEKEALSQGLFYQHYPTGEAAWSARDRDIKPARHVVNNYSLKRFKAGMDYTDNFAYDSKMLEYRFEWTIETVLKKIHNVND